MWMNEMEIDDAGERYREHPVLGPAARTLDNLRNATNQNSDGWPYYKKPAQAAGKLMELIRQGQRHDREAYQLPRTPAVTADEYKKALVPVKAFRTRSGWSFGIEEPGPGIGGPVWAAERAYEDAVRLGEQALERYRIALAAKKAAGAALDEARRKAQENGWDHECAKEDTP